MKAKLQLPARVLYADPPVFMPSYVVRRVQTKTWFRAYTEGLACIYCGNMKVVWHHRIPRKPGEPKVYQLIHDAVPVGRIIAELEKCDPVCRGCHNTIHFSTDTKRTHCLRGHVYTIHTSKVWPFRLRRFCRECERLRDRTGYIRPSRRKAQ